MLSDTDKGNMLAGDDFRTSDDDRLFPLTRETEEALAKIRRLPGTVATMPLVDCYMGRQESPTSLTVLNDENVFPELAANVINCGMGLLDTGLDSEEVCGRDLDRWVRLVVQLGRVGTRSFSREQAQSAFVQGVPGLVAKGLVSDAVAEGFELGGQAIDGLNHRRSLTRYVPPTLLYSRFVRENALWSLGGNHFLEIQVVRTFGDAEDAGSPVGLSPGRVVVMLHTDFRVTGALNYHFVRRKRLEEKSVAKRAAYSASKWAFQLASGRPSLNRVKALKRLYGRRVQFTPMPLGHPETDRYLTARGLAANYAYAGRAMLYEMMLSGLRNIFGTDGARARLVWDCDHESIRRRELNGRTVVCHRKGSVEAMPGKPVLIAGGYDYPSLLGVSPPKVPPWASYDHGSSHVNARITSTGDGHVPVSEGREVLRYRIAGRGDGVALVDRVALRSTNGFVRQVEALSRMGVVSPVAWLVPIANVKGRLLPGG